MLRYLTTQDLAALPRLSDSMFRDRARQFHTRRGWNLRIDGDGRERDQYDGLPGALYVVWERPDGTHGGSMRFLPTTGRTMLAEHFAALGFTNVHNVVGGIDAWSQQIDPSVPRY